MRSPFLLTLPLIAAFGRATPLSVAPQTLDCSSAGLENSTNVVPSGDFEHRLRPWRIAARSVRGSIVGNGTAYCDFCGVQPLQTDPAGHSVKTANLAYGRTFSMTQTIHTCPKVDYFCQFDYYFDKSYNVTCDGEAKYPMIWVGVRSPDGNNTSTQTIEIQNPDQAGAWKQEYMGFRAGGSDIVEVRLSSPQQASKGGNFAQVDNLVCRPVDSIDFHTGVGSV